MKTSSRFTLRLSALLASFALSAAAFAATGNTAVIPLEGEMFGNNLEAHASSGGNKIAAAERYNYKVSGKIHGKGSFANFVPSQTIAEFVESIESGSSASLKGDYTNSGGTLPFTFLDQTYSGDRTMAGFTVHFNVHVVGRANAAGKLFLDVTDVQVTLNGSPINGSIVFESGALVKVTVTRVVQFQLTSTSVSENAGKVALVVRRSGNTSGSASVQFGTEGSSDVITNKSGTITFENGEVKKTINVKIIDDAVSDGNQFFVVFLYDPTGGAVVGEKAAVNVTVLDDENAN